MTYFHTCQTCAASAADCSVRTKLAVAVAGLGVGSIKHKCSARVPLYTPGAAVLVKTYAWISGGDDYEDSPPVRWYRGRFVKHSGPRLLVFVQSGTIPEDGTEEHAFEPKGTGFIKASRSCVKPSDWAEPISVEPCRWCSAITTIGQPCGFDPNYTPAASCQERQRAAEIAPEGAPQSPSRLSAEGRSEVGEARLSRSTELVPSPEEDDFDFLEAF